MAGGRHHDAEHQRLRSAVNRAELRLARVLAGRDRLRAQAAQLEAEFRRLEAQNPHPEQEFGDGATAQDAEGCAPG